VAEHPNPLVRDQYVMTIADRCRLDVHLVRERLDLHVSGKVQKPVERSRRSVVEEEPPPVDDGYFDDGDPGPPAEVRRQESKDRAGLEALRIAVHHPELVAGRLEAFLFLESDQRAAFDTLLSATSLASAIESAPPPAAALLRRVAVEEPLLDQSSALDPVGPVIAQLIRAAVRRELGQLQAQLRSGALDVAAGAAQVTAVHKLLEQLDDPREGSTAEAALLDWLAERSDTAL